jgi:signal transduction histidine kinase
MRRVRRRRPPPILDPFLDPEEHATPPTGFEAIQREELSRLFGRMVKARLAAAPVLVAFFAWLGVGDPAPWRRAVIAVAVPALALFFLGEAVRYRRHGLGRRSVERNLTVAVVGQLVLAAATGGIESPFVPVAIPIAMLAGLFLPRHLAYALSTVQVASVLALTAVAVWRPVPALMPAALGGGGPRATAHLVATGVLLGAVAVMSQGAGRVLRRALDATLRRALAAQEDALRAHAERTEELTALSAEIAHELKNPLASVKGLASLLTAADARGQERLGVLRREVDRMQGVLDEFLNFSRPLVPLALGRVDVAALAREVVLLHEGIAHQRGVALEPRLAPAEARCDPRKVKQVLVNLVQNALDASAPGGTVEVEVRAEGGAARVKVLDRGRGLDPTLHARAFEPGVTTKPLGSGLGLTIARALARQHGGEVTLAARSGGGCAAELVLPGAAGRGRAA